MGLISWIKNTAQQTRQAVIETGARAYINHLLKRFGTMTNLTIDSKTKTIHAELDLKGESSPIKIDVANYILLEEKGELFIEINGVQTSREWLNLVAEQFLKNKRVKIPNVP